MNKSKLSIVSETNIGIYVWKLPNGEFLADDDLNILSIEARRGDLQAMAVISRVAKNLGFDGSPVFEEGYRKISDEEFGMQLERLRNGLTPDPMDIGDYQDEVRKLS